MLIVYVAFTIYGILLYGVPSYTIYMNYVEVAVDHKTVRGTNTLTYSSTAPCAVGDIVRVPIRSSYANGVVIKRVTKPNYPTKPIQAHLYKTGVPPHLLKTLQWIKNYYGVDLSQAIQLGLPRGIHKKRRSQEIQGHTTSKRNQSHTLTKEQKAAISKIEKYPKQTILLHGVTGSGKTRIYIERIGATLARGMGAIVLVPEIGLTSQMVSDIQTQFNNVFVLHSQQSESDRHNLWERIQKSDSPIVIGPRSALFAPVRKLGLIIIDEEHEQSYKQDQSPKYNAIRVASVLAKHAGAQLILGSATPSIEDYYLASERKLPIVELKNSVTHDVNKTTIELVDLKNRNNFKKSSALLSDQLLAGVESALLNQQQALIFLNRRGSSTSLLCSNCGWHAECPHCMLPLTHHADWQKLICHVCNYHSDVFLSCPNCNKPKLLYKGLGTKQIVTELSKIFPNKKIARFDADTKKGEQLIDRYDEIIHGDIDILVGTQMVVKGLDIPRLSMVGVVLADASLYLPDFTANERTFQLLSQVIGRTGRHTAGTVIIQTYAPDNPTLLSAASGNYTQFYMREIEERRTTHYPPFMYLLKLTCERVQLATVQKNAQQLAHVLRTKYPKITILGPSPALHEKTKTGYRWQLVIKSVSRTDLLQIIENDIPAQWQHDLDPASLL